MSRQPYEKSALARCLESTYPPKHLVDEFMEKYKKRIESSKQPQKTYSLIHYK